MGFEFLVAERFVGNKLGIRQVLFDNNLDHSQQQIHIRAGPDPEVTVGLTAGFGNARVHHHHSPVFVAGQAFQRVGGIMAAIADVRVGAHDQQKVGVVVVGMQHGAGRAVQHPFFDQPVLALLLGQ